MCPLFAFLDSPLEMLILIVLAVLLFGERLPEVAQTWGKKLIELKKGIHSIQQEIQNAVNEAASVEPPPKHSDYEEPEDREEATAPKFEPPPSNP